MSRLGPLDKALVLILVPLWAVCFALSVRSSLREDPLPLAFVASPATPEDYPTVKGLPAWLEPERSEIRPGTQPGRATSMTLRSSCRIRTCVPSTPKSTTP